MRTKEEIERRIDSYYNEEAFEMCDLMNGCIEQRRRQYFYLIKIKALKNALSIKKSKSLFEELREQRIMEGLYIGKNRLDLAKLHGYAVEELEWVLDKQ